MELRPYKRKTHYYETDQMGIIHHANYIHWLEEARVDFMEQIGYGYEKAVSTGIDFAVLNVSCEYKSMVHFNDTVLIQVSLSSLSSMKMTVQYTITDAVTGKLMAVGESSHCFYDNKRQRPVALRRALPEVYEIFAQLLNC